MNRKQIIVTDLSISMAFLQFLVIIVFIIYIRIKDTKLIMSGNCISTTKAYAKKFLLGYKKKKEAQQYKKQALVTVVLL